MKLKESKNYVQIQTIYSFKFKHLSIYQYQTQTWNEYVLLKGLLNQDRRRVDRVKDRRRVDRVIESASRAIFFHGKTCLSIEIQILSLKNYSSMDNIRCKK